MEGFFKVTIMMETFVDLVCKSTKMVIFTSVASRTILERDLEFIILSIQNNSTKVNILLKKDHGKMTYHMVKVFTKIMNPLIKDHTLMA